MWKPSYYQRSWIRSGQRFWSCSGEPFLYNLPLVITTCGFSSLGPKYHYARTDSATFSVELVVGGDAEFRQDGKTYVVKPGQVFLVRRGCNNEFHTGPSGSLRKRMVLMEGVMLSIVLQSLGLNQCDVVSCRNPPRLANLIKRSNRVMGEAHPDYSWALSALAYEILLELARSTVQAQLPPEVARALAFMNTNIEKALSLRQIAASSGLSMFHFSRVFNRAVRVPPMTYFQKQKVRLARNLLLNSGLLVKEIAAVLGYDDPFYFSAQFRKQTGLSPRQFRSRGNLEE